MKFRYSEWRDEQDLSKLSFEELLRLFSQLLLYTNGDPNEALKMMTQMDQEYNLFAEREGESFEEDLAWRKRGG